MYSATILGGPNDGERASSPIRWLERVELAEGVMEVIPGAEVDPVWPTFEAVAYKFAIDGRGRPVWLHPSLSGLRL